jgi:hypothetical protein
MAVVDEQVTDDEQTDDEPADDDEQTDDEAADDDEHDEHAHVVEAPPKSEKEIERALKALDKEAQRHRDAVSRIMGDDALQLLPCELCETAIPGFRFPTQPDELTRQAVLAAIGMGAAGEYATDDEAAMCERCSGFGVLVTGSRVEAQRTRVCPDCGGNGWKLVVPNVGQVVAAPVLGAAPPAPAPAPVAPVLEGPPPPADMYGRPFGHVNYGRMPAYMTADERAADPYLNG